MLVNVERPKDMATLGIKIPDAAYDELVQEAEAKGATLANHVRAILDEHFERQGKKIQVRVKWGGDRRNKESDKS